MPGGCVVDTAEIQLQLVGVPAELQANLILSLLAGNGLEVLDDGAYAPGYNDLQGGGFPTIPPSPPGDMLVKAAIGSNASWTFRYNPLSTVGNAWEFIGGAPYYVDVETQGTVSSGAGSGTYSTWADLHATDVRGPDFAVPFNGVYIIEFGATINSAAGEEAQCGIDTTAGATPSANNTATAPGTSGQNFASVMRAQQLTMNSGDTWRMFYRCTGTEVAAFQRRWLKVTPVRVGGARAAGTYSGT